MMKTLPSFLIWGLIGFATLCTSADLRAQDAQTSTEKQANKSQPSSAGAKEGQSYSGMYSFLKDGEFVQLTVEDGSSVTGFVSRFGDGGGEKGAFSARFF